MKTPFIALFLVSLVSAHHSAHACRPAPVRVGDFAQQAANYIYENKGNSALNLAQLKVLKADRRGPIVNPQCPFGKDSYGTFQINFNEVKYLDGQDTKVCDMYTVTASTDQGVNILSEVTELGECK